MMRIFLLLLTASFGFPLLAQELPLPVSEIDREEPVDFAREIMPVLKRNCLACHHANEAEGGLVLESAEQLRTGGDSGPGADPNEIEASSVFVRAAGIEEPLMPPEDNSVGAKPLTPEELGLLKKWIEQGAKDSDSSDSEMIQWQPIPESIKTVYSLDIGPAGRFAAVGRGNRVLVIDPANGKPIQQLVDRSLLVGEVADVDLIQSIATSPDGQRIATGGFRTVRIWKNVPQPAELTASPLMRAVGQVAIHPDGTRAAMVNAIGDVEIWSLTDNQLQHSLAAHRNSIVDIAWAGPGSVRLVSVDAAGQVNLWDANNGEKTGETKVPAAVHDTAVSSRGSELAIVDINGGLHIFNVTEDASITPVSNFASDVADARAVNWTGADAPLLHVASGTKVRSFSFAENKLVREVDHGAALHSLAVTPDGQRLASGAEDGSAKIWNLADGKLLATLQGDPQSQLQLVDARQDAARQKAAVERLNGRTAELEKLLAAEVEVVNKATEEQKKAKETFDAEAKKHQEADAQVAATETKIEEVSKQLKQAEQSIAASMQELTSATSTADELEKSIASQKQELTDAQKTVSEVQAKIDELTKARDEAAGKVASVQKVIAAKDAALKAAREKATMAEKQQQEAKAKAEQAKAEAEKAKKELEAQQKAAAAAKEAKQKSEAELTKRDRVLASANAAKQRAEAAIPEHKSLIEAESRRQALLDSKASQLESHLRQPIFRVPAMAFNEDGSRLATAHADGSIRVFQTSGTPTHSFDSGSLQPWSQVLFVDNTVIGFSPQAKAQSFSTASQWQLETTIGAIEDDSIISDRVTALDFGDRGMTIAVGSGPPSRFGEVKVFAVHDGRMVRDFGQVHSDTVLSLEFSPTGQRIASASADKTIRLLDVSSGQLIRSLEGHTHHVLGVDWQDDGQTLASASADQSIKIWDTETGEQRRTIDGFKKETTAVDFVRDTNQIVAASADGNVRLSDTSNGKTLRNFSAGNDFLFTVAVSPDGTQIIAGGQSGVVRSWNLADGKLLFELK